MKPWKVQWSRVRSLQINKHTGSNRKLFDFAGACKVKIDYDKYRSSRDNYLTGLNNYTVFQKFSNFRWPAWINAITDTSLGASSLVPHMLVNSVMRDCLYFTNFLSDDGLYIDPAGMMSPSYDHWSLETWIVEGRALYRPAVEWDRVRQERDTKNSIIHMIWENDVCKLRQTMYGARGAADEAVVETECSLKERKNASLLFVVRPYDRHNLGGLESVEYLKELQCMAVNGRKSLCLAVKPDFFFSGGGEECRDIDPWGGGTGQGRSASPFGMATLAAGYTLKKGDNRMVLRIAIDSRAELKGGKYDYERVREDFTAFSSMRIRNGANLGIPDRQLQNWFYGSKISLLNFSLKNIIRENGSIDYRAAFYIIFGCNRMGYFTESLRYIDFCIKGFAADEKNLTFDMVIDACAMIDSIADYFIHVRDTGFLQGRFEFIKRKALLLYNYSRKLKKFGSHGRNSLEFYYIAEDHPFDLIRISHALAQYSYLARCLGIFGDETRFRKEAGRIAVILAGAAFDRAEGLPENEFILYNLFAGYPFRIEGVTADHLRGLLERMRAYFGDATLFVKSLGVDTVSSLVAANNLIMMKDPKCDEIVRALMGTKSGTYVLPEFMNPSTGRASWGDGASMTASAMMFATIRNILFVDYPERLDLFPRPRPEWFEPGNEIKIDDMPSRFGLISLRMASTVNEIQVHFEKLPKFVPPDIMINLPFRTKIKLEDDFILKREDDMSYIINGWPSIVRFMRR
ncbi:MAG TPA: hypothetical protein P5203_16430 [Spirochaetota bacterium]|nr:hypothetical protein [Spirochaetota bacterium]HRT76700.1 hypothetical protein [Spirochaetota bacterium]